jgi:hypothetical protein
MFVMALVISGTPPDSPKPSTHTKKQIVQTDGHTVTATDAILNEQLTPVHGKLLRQVLIERAGSFENRIRLPEAPSFKTDHVPRL